MAEAQNNQNYRFTVSFTSDLTNYLQADEFLNPIITMLDPDANGEFPICGGPTEAAPYATRLGSASTRTCSRWG
jgi:hypothetical protein